MSSITERISWGMRKITEPLLVAMAEDRLVSFLADERKSRKLAVSAVYFEGDKLNIQEQRVGELIRIGYIESPVRCPNPSIKPWFGSIEGGGIFGCHKLICFREDKIPLSLSHGNYNLMYGTMPVDLAYMQSKGILSSDIPIPLLRKLGLFTVAILQQ